MSTPGPQKLGNCAYSSENVQNEAPPIFALHFSNLNEGTILEPVCPLFRERVRAAAILLEEKRLQEQQQMSAIAEGVKNIKFK